jgi:hypothetical protein
VFKNKPLRLVHGVVIFDPLLRINLLQVNTFDMIPHLRNAVKVTYPLLIALQFVANTDWALGLGKDERKRLKIR